MTDYTERISNDATAPPADLPPHIIRLARAIATVCASEGTYEMTLTVPSRRLPLPVSFEIHKAELIRRWEFDR